MTFSLKNQKRTALAMLALGLGSVLTGCSNFPSRRPPVWVFWDMKKQEKYKAELSSDFFPDHRTSRRPVANTVSQELYEPVSEKASGVTEAGKYLDRNPLPLTMATLNRGQERYNIYCAPCHDRTGLGKGIVPSKATWIPANIHEERIVNMVDGELFHVVTNGRRSMPGYRFQISQEDRWAIVAYVRALQRSWRGSMSDVPADLQAKLR